MLCTGRCGSLTVAKALSEALNFTVSHESRSAARDRLEYPDQHVEVDNRLSWCAASLVKRYPDALYVHLTRDPEAVIRSFRRRESPLVRFFADGVLKADPHEAVPLMVQTVTDRLEAVLKPVCSFRLSIEDPYAVFDRLWVRMGAVGDLEAAHGVLSKTHNATEGA